MNKALKAVPWVSTWQFGSKKYFAPYFVVGAIQELARGFIGSCPSGDTFNGVAFHAALKELYEVRQLPDRWEITKPVAA